MGKINGNLKFVFILFNVLYAGLGCVLIYGAIHSDTLSAQVHTFTLDQYSAFGTPGFMWVWVFAIGVISMSCLGTLAAWSEKGLLLKTFAGLMGVGMVIMLVFGIVTVAHNEQAKDSIDSTYFENEEQQKKLKGFQEAAQCCGISGASDWGDEIPQSCACTEQPGYSSESFICKDKPLGTTGPKKIWREGCKDFILSILDVVIRITSGVFFGFAVTALLGLLISLLMIHQVNN